MLNSQHFELLFVFYLGLGFYVICHRAVPNRWSTGDSDFSVDSRFCSDTCSLIPHPLDPSSYFSGLGSGQIPPKSSAHAHSYLRSYFPWPGGHHDNTAPAHPLSRHCLPTIATVPKARQWHTLSIHILKGPTPPAPHVLGFVLPLARINFHRHHSQWCQSFSPC